MPTAVVVFDTEHPRKCLDDILAITMWENYHGIDTPYPVARYFNPGMDIPKSILKFVHVTHRKHLNVLRVNPLMIKEAQDFTGTYYS